MQKLRLAAMLAATCLAAPAQSFGLRSHLWIADQVFEDLADCSLTIQGEQFAIPAETCEAVRSDPERFRGHFLAGAIGPDAFPDLLVGQSIIHPGAENRSGANLGAEFWLDRLLSRAELAEEIAFSWGFATHYAGDTFAHSYVNNYAGDVFELADGTPSVELRHFRLEKYIDQFLDYAPPADRMMVPAAFLARELMHDDLGSVVSPSPVATAHIRTMLAARTLAVDARDELVPEIVAEAKRDLARERDALFALEQRLGVEPPFGVPLDRRSARPETISRAQWRELHAAHARYQAAVDVELRSRALTTFAAGWPADIEAAFEHYIRASLDFGRAMALTSGQRLTYTGPVSMLAPYRNWADCYGSVLRGAPLEAGEAICARREAMATEIDLEEVALRATLGRRARSLYLDLMNLNRNLQRTLISLAIDLTTIADRNAARLARELIDPAHINAAALNNAFQGSDNGQLSFLCVQDWIDADLGLFLDPAATPRDGVDRPCGNAPRRAHFDPYQFRPLANAVTLAKLALLDQARVRNLARTFGSDPAELRMSDRRRYSVLLDGVRSLDGSHQWQSVSMPFPRRRGAPELPFVSAGYGSRPGVATGFPLYRTTGLRAGAFTRLFPGPFEGRILERPEMRPPLYRFRPCDGDPFRPHHPTGESVGCPGDRRAE